MTVCVEGQKTISECQRLLRNAKKDMLGIFGNLQEEKIVSAEEKTLFRYYCEAILILGHFQRPGAVEGMTVPGWLNKTHLNGRVCVGVSQQIASFSLTPEESAFLDAHYLYVRPDCVRENVDDDGKFFISPKGRPIRSASNDLSRLHAHYKIPSVTSQEIQRVVETAASTAFNEEQKAMVAHYMAHSTPVANTHYRLRTAICTTAVCASLAGYSSEEESAGSSKKRGRDSSEEDINDNKDFDNFVEVFPVTLTGQPPTKNAAGFPQDRCFYDKWRAAQFGKREGYLLHPPTVDKVGKMVKKQGWTANHPRPEDIVAKWRPPKKCHIETDEKLMKRIRKQKWSWLAIKDYEDKRGQGVNATRAFVKGAVICDYHGELVTAEEGRKILESSTDEMGYLYFFTSGSQQLCINAQTHPCRCHPTMETMGRKMNHSKNNLNVKPQHCKIKFPEGEKDTLLLVAARDIAVDEELRFDYGVNRKSFRGEGLDREWLDE
ncbi:hypothetical protein Q5P01_000661 [Channa striata]|uniref:SET domain-containing protein n=1 Tax=Channa striata TaxID=64152 RepID=A0AA88LIY0_CHASR|nr:hypothetical protein Q5P01_000661 [Channa striata]